MYYLQYVDVVCSSRSVHDVGYPFAFEWHGRTEFGDGRILVADVKIRRFDFPSIPRSVVKGWLLMATATAPRTEVYLSLLAARAVTSLVRFTGDPSAWNQRIEDGLQDGIRYCQAVRARGRPVLVGSSTAPSPLRRLVDGAAEGESVSSEDDSKRVEEILSDILSKTRRAQLPELAAAIELLRKTATER